ncbi:MAG: hypothetical protein QGG40_11840, partial [Myxococcota bacterium]|nr:hypothetical protein [Myxococcota bacterium]
MLNAPPYVEVAVVLPVDGTFTYQVPSEMSVGVGSVVVVPFRHQKVTGYVVGLPEQSEVGKLKSILRVLDPAPVFDVRQLALFRWIANYYLASLGETIATALPPGFRARGKVVFRPTEDGISELATGALEEGPRLAVLREVVAKPARTRRGLARGLRDEIDADDCSRALEALIRSGLVTRETLALPSPGQRITTLRLSAGHQELPEPKGIRMASVLSRLRELGHEVDLSEIVRLEGSSARDAIRRLEARGFVVRSSRESRDAVRFPELLDETVPVELNHDQRSAVEQLTSARQGTYLLHGVTGSG